MCDEKYTENCLGQIEIVLLNNIKNNGYWWVGTITKSRGLFVQQILTKVMV